MENEDNKNIMQIAEKPAFPRTNVKKPGDRSSISVFVAICASTAPPAVADRTCERPRTDCIVVKILFARDSNEVMATRLLARFLNKTSLEGKISTFVHKRSAGPIRAERLRNQTPR
jgi:hypothetical protein